MLNDNELGIIVFEFSLNENPVFSTSFSLTEINSKVSGNFIKLRVKIVSTLFFRKNYFFLKNKKKCKILKYQKGDSLG